MYKLIIILLYIFFINISQVGAADFTVEPLSEVSKQEMIKKKVWYDGCPVNLNRLRLIKFPYYDFNSVIHHDGELVVFDAASEHVVVILKRIYALKYPIAKARTVENYDGDDDKSMADNNSSSFNCREITGGGLPSIHSYGLAIDINPIQNPYLSIPSDINQTGAVAVKPAAGSSYLNRTNIRPGMSEVITDLFAKNGFSVWGGKRNTPIDWQHFQTSGAMAQLLAVMNYNDGYILFKLYTKTPQMFNSMDRNNNQFVELYKKNPNMFMQCLKKSPKILSLTPKQAYEILSKCIVNH
ncbi:M15 family metallopeptidase [Candidatus Tisiphia endosymbiont of Ptychoptera albimana]|uniref:M15 family metallopeptidase n=1 Tax=Candidatus Tisiphia endosymbiont of Ptychoptera albimana TaxID=3066260 RepID=UPI00312C892F